MCCFQHCFRINIGIKIVSKTFFVPFCNLSLLLFCRLITYPMQEASDLHGCESNHTVISQKCPKLLLLDLILDFIKTAQNSFIFRIKKPIIPISSSFCDVKLMSNNANLFAENVHFVSTFTFESGLNESKLFSRQSFPFSFASMLC